MSRARHSRRQFLRLSLGAAGGLVLAGCSRSSGLDLGLRRKELEGYKALVCVFLHGGNDGYNTLVPVTPEKYRLYSDARLDLAVPREQLLALQGVAADGCEYGLNPSCSELAGLFNQDRAAVLSGVGSLLAPTQRADFIAGRVPPGLFSHLDQREQWQTARPDMAAVSGWAGRIGDVLAGQNGGGELPLNVSLAGNNLLQRGVQTDGFPLLSTGPQRLSLLGPEGSYSGLRSAFDQLLAGADGDAFEQTYAETLGRGVQLNELLADQLEDAAPLGTSFPANNPLAEQLELVARLISCRAGLDLRRQIYFVSLGGFDNHGDQSTVHAEQLQKLSQALKAFYDATVEMGVANQVTAFTASDFGRSLTVNGKGTDHGWSNHHFIVGGAVAGGRIYGQPPSLEVGGADDTRGGRFIPQTSVDEYTATLARWFGVSDSDLGYVLPNIGRFASRDLGFMV